MKLNTVKKHLMTGISYMIPVVVAGGLCMALARVFGLLMGLSAAEIPDISKMEGTIPWMVNSIGSAAMTFVVPVMTAFIAYSIADRPGLAPGLTLGLIANNLKAGFLGGILAGFLVGYFILWMKTWKVGKSIQGLMPVMIIPFLTCFVIGFAFYLGLSKPVAMATEAITNSLKNMQAGGAKFGLGAIIGGMMGFDLGGPVNKTASAFCNGLLAEGITAPTAAKIVGGMTPALGIAATVLIQGKKKWDKAQIETAKAAVPLGLCFITEGVLPFAAADPIRVIISTCAGAAVAGGLTQIWGVASPVPHGGIFVVPVMDNPGGFLLALVIGSAVTAVLYFILRMGAKEIDNSKEDLSELDSLDLDF
ncbi:PTS fructose transporter subunit IIC [Oscillospiraceae bacterium MB08-C2-2]|nr:PTS fructose transporter subunit IIC [Oscillospiraceae bacterium MB08-C2-2]